MHQCGPPHLRRHRKAKGREGCTDHGSTLHSKRSYRWRRTDNMEKRTSCVVSSRVRSICADSAPNTLALDLSVLPIPSCSSQLSRYKPVSLLINCLRAFFVAGSDMANG